MKAIIICIIAIIILTLSLYSCKGKAEKTPAVNEAVNNQAVQETNTGAYQPSEKQIVEEFKQVWNTVHGPNINKSSYWRLVKTEIGSIRVDEKAKSATVSIKFTYIPGSKQERTKAADFLFHEVEGLWRIDKETAKYPVTP